MLQLGQNSTAEIIQNTGLLLIVHSNYRYRASFKYCHLTAISQCNYHASAQNDGQLVLFDQLCSKKAVNGATINQRSTTSSY